ncbi:hypothetical protein [Lysobacter terrae]
MESKQKRVLGRVLATEEVNMVGGGGSEECMVVDGGDSEVCLVDGGDGGFGSEKKTKPYTADLILWAEEMPAPIM